MSHLRLMFCSVFTRSSGDRRTLHSVPTRRSSDLAACVALIWIASRPWWSAGIDLPSRKEHVLLTCQKWIATGFLTLFIVRSEEHTSELQSQSNLVCRLLLEKKNYIY